MIDGNARRLYLGRDPGVMALDLDTKKITDVLVPAPECTRHFRWVIPVCRQHERRQGYGDGVRGQERQGKGTVPTGKMPDAAALTRRPDWSRS